MNPTIRRLTAPTILLALFALLGSIFVAAQARASHGDLTLYVSGPTLPTIKLAGESIVSLTPYLSDTAPHDILIGAELAGSPNDPDNLTDPLNPMSFGDPDYWCVIPSGEITCQIDVHVGYASPLGTGDIVWVFIDDDDAVIDTAESAPMTPVNTSLIYTFGCQDEPDATAVVSIRSIGLAGADPQGDGPAPGANPDPKTCEDLGGSPSPTPTETGTPPPTESGSPSPTPTTTGTPSPTPTETITMSPTPTPAPTPVQVASAPYDGRFRSTDCHTTPASDTSSCATGTNIDQQTGAFGSIAQATSPASAPEPFATATSSAGVEHGYDASAAGYRELTLIFRFRIELASISTTTAAGSPASPTGTSALTVHAESACGTADTSYNVKISGNSEIRGRLIELRVTLYPGSCDSHGAVSFEAGVTSGASTSPVRRGSSRVETQATLLEVLAV